jgi:hypothetical protein
VVTDVHEVHIGCDGDVIKALIAQPVPQCQRLFADEPSIEHWKSVGQLQVG